MKVPPHEAKICLKVQFYIAQVPMRGFFDGVINCWVIKQLSVQFNNKLPSGRVLQRFFTSMTLPRIEKYVDLISLMRVINYVINE